jgi:DNA (cytosine-5)-methyltransferase 1
MTKFKFIDLCAGIGGVHQYLKDNNLEVIADMPKWKQNIILKNHKLYYDNSKMINKWRDKYDNLARLKPTDRKFEWQMGGIKDNNLYDGIIQFRTSGVRVKKANFIPALVAMVHTPIIGKLLRRLTPRECARLQSFPDSFIINKNEHQAYKQFGNSINIDVVKYIFNQTILPLIN